VADTAAVVDALASGHLAGAGIDVLEQETPPADSPVLRAWRDPSHPKLLDWLANEFLKSGGSLKSMHRLICNSATYKQDFTEGNKGSKGASASWQAAVK